MGISRTEAASALTDIEQATGRTHELRGYRLAGPILVIWGVIWVLGYAAMGLFGGQRAGIAWLPLDLIGVAATLLMVHRARTRATTGMVAAPTGATWRSAAGALAVTAFITITFILFKPVSSDVFLVYPGVLCGLIYVVLGIWRMPRFVWVGLAVATASLVGYALFAPWLAWWMAVVGGGGLILGGLWMRRA